jgi:DNA polymerase-3 subunit delta'
VKSFSQILGQERAIGFLKKVISGEKIPHAYLFTGINGVGKKSTALALAQAVNCQAPVDYEGCGQCLICRQMDSGNFPDRIFVEPDGRNIKIEQIRELNRNLNYKPVSGKYRICIIDRAEMMTEEAANSFLKTLEEPPPGNIIILKVVDPLDLLPTIVSRCQRVPFRPLPLPVIQEWLVSEMHEDSQRALLIAGLSEGSLGKAIEIRESRFLDHRKETLSKMANLPDLSSAQVLEMSIDYTKRYSKGSSGSSTDMGLFELMGIWKTWYRDMIIIKTGGPENSVINRDFMDNIKNISDRIDRSDLIECFMSTDRAQRHLMRNPNTGLLLEKTLLDLRGYSRKGID